MWLIEEVRVAQLAPGAHVRPGATVKRVREALAVAESGAGRLARDSAKQL